MLLGSSRKHGWPNDAAGAPRHVQQGSKSGGILVVLCGLYWYLQMESDHRVPHVRGLYRRYHKCLVSCRHIVDTPPNARCAQQSGAKVGRSSATGLNHYMGCAPGNARCPDRNYTWNALNLGTLVWMMRAGLNDYHVPYMWVEQIRALESSGPGSHPARSEQPGAALRPIPILCGSRPW